MNFLDSSRPWATTSSVGAPTPWSVISDQAWSVASASIIAIATSSLPSSAVTTRPATTMANTARSSSLCRGKAIHWPSTRAIRVAPTGPENGSPEIWVDIDAPFMASTS